MKWVTFISCLFLASFAESKHLPRRYRDVEVDTIKLATEVPSEDFACITTALVSQYMQEATFEEENKLMNDILALAKKCAAEEHSDCEKPLGPLFLDAICHEQGFAEKHVFDECCGKVEPERKECFLSHKNATPGFIPRFQHPSVEEGCKEYHDNKEQTMHKYIHGISKKNPSGNIATICKSAHAYGDVLETCCLAADKDTCFGEKARAVSEQLRRELGVQKQTCSILKKGEPVLKAIKLTQLAQKFPKADFATLDKIMEDIVHVHTECCKGDTLECLLDRKKVTAYVCSHQDTISSKVHVCCEKPLLERGECLVTVENDDKPADLSPTVREFIEGKEVCQHYAENKNGHVANFLYEYSRRHPGFSVQMLLRLAKGYQDLVEKCCATEHPETCLPGGEEQLKKHVADTLAVVKANCDAHANLGDYPFQNELLIRYTKKAPQLSAPELLRYTKELTKIANRCCKLDDDHRLKCAEEYTFLVLGGICEKHKEHHINKQVCGCCGSPYPFRRECFSVLGVDPEYVPAPFNPELFTFHADFCAAEVADQQTRKQTLLVNLLKHKPAIEDDQLAVAIVDFTEMTTKCCAAEDREGCLATEGPKLVEKTRAALGEE